MGMNFNINRLLAQRKRALADMQAVANCDIPQKLRAATTVPWHINSSCQMWCEVSNDTIDKMTQGNIFIDKLLFWERQVLPVWAAQVNDIAEAANIVCEMELDRQEHGTVFIVTPESVIKYREMKYDTYATYIITALATAAAWAAGALIYGLCW